MRSGFAALRSTFAAGSAASINATSASITCSRLLATDHLQF
jgi:hypothetical protein